MKPENFEADHDLAIADQWASTGHAASWQSRKDWVGDMGNLEPMEKRHNASKNANARYHDNDVRTGFDGPAQAAGFGAWWADVGVPFGNAPEGIV